MAAELIRWLEDNRIRHYNRSGKSNEKVLTITRARELALDSMLILTPPIDIYTILRFSGRDSSPLSIWHH